MSTDLYGVRVLESEGDSLLLEVFITYSDIETLPRDTHRRPLARLDVRSLPLLPVGP